MLLMVVLCLVLGAATSGLLKVGLEQLMPSSPWLQHMLRYEEVTTVDGTSSYTWDLGRASRRWLLLVTLAVFLAGRRFIPWSEMAKSGFRGDPRWRERLLTGLSASLVMVVIYEVGLLLSPWGRWEIAPLAYLARKIPEFAVGAVLVALLEELFFRAVMLQAMVRQWGVTAGIVVSSLVYAVLHCISGGYRVSPGWDPAVGLRLLAAYYRDPSGSYLPDVQLVIGLFLLGTLLALLFLRTGSVWTSVGLHAGIVFTARSAKKLIGRVPGTPDWLVGDPLFIVSGVATWPLLLAAIVVAWWLTRPRKAAG